MTLTLQVLVSGLAAGGVYGLVAIGYTLIYRLTGVVQLAFGSLVGLGVFATLLVAAGVDPVARAASTPRFVIALLAGLAVCIGAGVLTYWVAVQPFLARGSTLGWVAATLALAFALKAALDTAFARSSYVFPDPLHLDRIGRAGFVRIGGASVQARAFVVLGIAVVLAAAAGWTLERTRFGRGLRAISADIEGARVVGVPVDRLVALAFGLTGGLAALAAVVAAPSAPFDTQAGLLLGLKGLVAALAVRFGSPWRAFAAGIVLGLLEGAIAGLRIAGAELGPEYREVIPLALVLLLLAVRPPLEAVEEVEWGRPSRAR
ncbi:MAG TPA: branched-chain amino acid ABC transporter permease [Gaiellaceae bacterium]